MKSEPIFLDTETCGFYGMPVLLQYAEGDGDIVLYSLWKEPIIDTLKLIEKMATHSGGIIGFNLAFDWFQLCKLYTTFCLFPDPHAIPEEHIDELAVLEEKARDGLCLKPVTAFDIMLHARRGPYQSTMNRKEIRIKRVPTELAWELAEELERRVEIKKIYFAKRKDKRAANWKVFDIEDDFAQTIVGFKDIVCKFYPSSALKTLAVDALNLPPDKTLLFVDIEVDEKLRPIEYGYAPFAKAGVISEKLGRVIPTGPGNWQGTWPDVIRFHISHWAYYSTARKYATDDVVYTRDLYKHFGSPPMGDKDSILSCMVAAVRWKGYKINKEGIQGLKRQALKMSASAPKAPQKAKDYLYAAMDPTERVIMGKSTKAQILEEIETWTEEDGKIHPAAVRAKEILKARKAQKEVELYDKLLHAGRFHASFVVLGTKSARMAGSDKLNPQGIKHTTEVRRQFPLAQEPLRLCGGDFDAFEVSIAEAVYADPQLRRDLQSGKKVHAIFGESLFPEMSYDDILASKGTDDDKYDKGKKGFFSQIYGGEAYTLHTRLAIPMEQAQEAYESFARKYKGVADFRKRIYEMFCSMRQPGGLGSKVEWHEPSEYIESMLGFRRYFTLENQICRVLYRLAEKPPGKWRNIKIKVVRRDRQQTASGATQSALFGAAFKIQAANMRAASNHLIQSPGAEMTKELQVRLWSLQPVGISEWRIQPMNVHDEVMAPSVSALRGQLMLIVKEFVEEFREHVPLLAMTWKNDLKSWGDK